MTATLKSVPTTPSAAVQPKKSLAKKTKVIPKVTAAEARSIGQGIAAVAAGFLPIASYVIAHTEVDARPWLWALVFAGLMFSAPTLADWAEKWCGGRYKAWGFTVLLEGVMIFAGSHYLSIAGLAILVAINCNSAWRLAGAKKGKV